MGSLISDKKPGWTGILFSNHILALFIIFAGITVRIINYFHNPGLWLDEASLSLNLIERSYSELLTPLYRNQVAPILFLWAEKLSINIFGQNELALRLFPLICSILSLPIFYRVSRHLLQDDRAALIALFILAFTPIQVRYSAEVKQYMTDVFAFLLLLNLFLTYWRTRKKKDLALLAAIGMVCIFLSYVSIFILFLIGAYWIISDIYYRRKEHSWIFALSAWLLSFGVLFMFFIQGHDNEAGMLRYWKDNFMPLNPFYGDLWDFLFTKGNKVFIELMIYFKGFISKSTYLTYNIFLLALYFTGVIFVILKGNKKMAYFLFLPVLSHLFLSGLHKYPFETRLSLYLAPLFYLTVSFALVQLLGLSKKFFHVKWPGTLLICIILIIFPYRLSQFFPFEIEGARESIYFINDHFKQDQHVYVNPYARNIYRFYYKIGKVNWEYAAIDGTMNGPVGNKRGAPLKDAEMLINKKGETWLLFTHLYPKVKADHDVVMERLREAGIIRLEYRSRLSAAYLVDLEE